jgi:uncharacterized protein involved in exopolysaccharide biosynthesis
MVDGNFMPDASRSDREIGLLEVCCILYRQRFWLVTSFIIASIISGTYLLFSPSLYESSVKLRVGHVAGTGLIEPVELLSSRLLAQYGENVANGVKRPRPVLKRAVIPRGMPTTLELVTEGLTPQDAASLLETIVKRIKESHDRIYRENVNLLSQRLAHLDVRRAALESLHKETASLIEQLRQRDPVQASLFMLERSRLASEISAIEAERPSLQQKLIAPQTLVTEALGEIAQASTPSSPKGGLILGLAVVLAIIIGVTLCFIAEALTHRTRK